MSDQHESGFAKPPLSDEGDRIGPLLRLAGPRETVPADRRHRVRAAVHAEWRQQTRIRSRRLTVGWSLGALAAAALVLIGVRVSVRDDTAGPIAPQEIATIESLNGPAQRVASGDTPVGGRFFQIGDRIRVGDGVDTMNGGLAALRLSSGASVRLDRGTRLRLLSGTALALEAGAIYVDSANVPGAPSLEVRTALGVARDIGTRFEVRFNGAALRVRVRDGLVRVNHSRQSHDASPGEELTLDGDGNMVRRPVPVFGAEWAWTFPLARPFDLEGRSLRDFLDWITGENGWQLRFADSAIEQNARTTILHGSILGLTPAEALAAVLPTSGVEHRLESGVLLVQLIAGGAKD